MSLDDLGNINPNFQNPERFVLPVGHFIYKNIALKEYDMHTGEISKIEVVGSMEDFLRDNIDKGNLDSRIGLGFVILSKDMLNVVRWDNKYPIVAVNSIYEFPEESRNVLESKQLSVDNFGSYCVWELGIVNHERKAWMNYLNSKRKEEDKLRYLNDFIEGELK